MGGIMQIGKVIREFRQSNGLSQRQLAKNVGISNTYLSDIENGRTTPSVKTFAKIARALTLDCNEIIYKMEL